MALKLELKAGERVMLGDVVIVNQGGRTRLTIEGDTPVLRERDLLPPGAGTSLARRLYLAMQSLHLARDGGASFRLEIARLAGEIVSEAPEWRPLIDAIDHAIRNGHTYRALREAQRLVLAESTGALAATG
ncbi:flagellar biosynthesis repressor FlbT [Kaistia geumhonensis]|uniref:Flagellar protein FlbT n=1 Tax=Kaistia geumhonensis TaxID=410839 RepID=A0ABU0MC55_9HYPH|nr:flagellar biosynthesis repressor FlbT [Kaistia geumhonensis]MCX5481490.1 flagellar biosynthesis repressor FlbT [Kaistia geumhonensis]MDQ0518555.1 flagellar protein FlbT [Kaistia geumhonensis]